MLCARHCLLIAASLLACASLHAQTRTTTHQERHQQQLSIDDRSLSWRSDEQRLRLHDVPGGIAVDDANALGLKAGDTLVQLDDAPLRGITALLDSLRARGGHSIALRVRDRSGNSRLVQLSASQYTPLLPPPAPDAPPPPAP